MVRVNQTPDESTVGIFNPTADDFSYGWLNDRNEKVVLSLVAQKVTYLPKYQADFMAKHLADHIMAKKKVKTNYRKEYNEVLNLIYT